MQLPRFLRSVLFLLATLLAFPGSVSAASTQPTPAPAEPVDPNFITIDFKGGPLSKLIAEIDAIRGTSFTLLNTTSGLDPMVPPFVVRQERVGTILVAVSALIRDQGVYIHPLGSNLAVLNLQEERKQAGFVAFQLEMQLNRLSLDEIISAIQSAYSFAVPGEKPDALRFKFHPGTKILFISGPQRNIDSIVRQVIQSLPFGPPTPPATPPPQQ